ncbi:hypothetical protein DFO80_10572 [Rhodobacter sp. 140A]|nr:hypothetical protein DFO80_10572 [Rhodobacter sp. 140A]
MDSIVEPRKPMREMSDREWKRQIAELGEDEGYYEPLGPAHAALFADRGPVLLVSFESRGAIRSRGEGQMPLGYAVAETADHSSLTLISDRDTWFRDPAVYAFFDRLVDDGFFEDFDRVVFYGAGPCGYAAAAFSVVAPGATVIAIQPQATLEPRLTGWDDRFTEMRRLCFTDRYGFAPDMLEGVGRAYVLFDPAVTLDAMHAALMARPWVELLACFGAGSTVERMLTDLDVLETMLTQACAGSFDAMSFWRLYRTRRTSGRYLRHRLAHLEGAGRTYLAAMLCRNVLRRMNAPRFRARLGPLEEALAAKGTPLPEPLPLPGEI